MSIIEAIILGLIQGLTEFIPISSSGHLVIAQYVMNGASNHLFVEWINLGTLLALIIYFWPRITGILKEIFQKKDYRLLINIVIAMLPAGFAGFFLANLIETQSFFSSPWTVVVTLALIGIILIIIERLPKYPRVPTLEVLPRSRVLAIGLVQMFALIPGVSRSGSTIIAGRLAGLSAAKAAEFSFLVSIPIMMGVILKLLVKSGDRAYYMQNFVPLTVGNIVAFISGLIAVKFLMKYLETRSLSIFGWYRLVLAVVLASVLLLQ